MALDRELFEEFVQGPHSLPILRIYQVTEPSVTVGRSWRGPLMGREPVCVRPTGGGLVRHGNDLIYSVIARRNSFPTFGMVRTSYLSFHEAIQAALGKLGIQSRLFRCDEARHVRHRKSVLTDCFQEPVATDLLVDEQKIAGGAQLRSRGAFLHQGSVQILKGSTFERLKESFLTAFQEKFSVVWEPALV